MNREYIVWTIRGKKTATTRMNSKATGLYRLGNRGKNYAWNPWGVLVEIYEVIDWKLADVPEKLLHRIAVDWEHFESVEEFVKVLIKLNKNRRDGREFDKNTTLYTLRYRVVECDEKLRRLYG